MTWFDQVWKGLADGSYFVAIISLIFTGLNYFRLWLPTEELLRNRCRSHREIVNEKVNKSFVRIIDRFERGLRTSELRGSPPNEPDLIADHTIELFRDFAFTLVWTTLKQA